MRDQVGWATLGAAIYLVLTMCQALPRIQSSQSRRTIISPILQMEKLRLRANCPKLCSMVWSGFGLHRPSTGSSGPLSVLCLPPGHSNLTALVGTGPLLQAGLGDLV